MSKFTNAQVVGHIALPAQAAPRERTRPLGSVVRSANTPEADRPVVRLPSGGHRAVASVRMIPHQNMCEITTVPDVLDGLKVRSFRLPLNTPVVGWSKTPVKAEADSTDTE